MCPHCYLLLLIATITSSWGWIKKVIKNSLYTFFPFLFILFFLFSIFIIKTDISYGHLAYSFWPEKAPLVKYYTHLYFKKIQNTKSLISEKKYNQSFTN